MLIQGGVTLPLEGTQIIRLVKQEGKLVHSANEQRFESELERLFDIDRIHAKHGPFGEEEFINELRAYYAALSSDEKLGFERAVLRWLRSEDALRTSQAISLCGNLAMRTCVAELLRIGEAIRAGRGQPDDMKWVVLSLGQIGDRRALDFLTQEALHGDYGVGAVNSLAEIDLGRALAVLPATMERFYRRGSPAGVPEALFSLLVESPDPDRAWAVGNALRDFPDKPYILDRFRAGLNQASAGEGRPLARGVKRRLLGEFQRGLQAGPHDQG